MTKSKATIPPIIQQKGMANSMTKDLSKKNKRTPSQLAADLVLIEAWSTEGLTQTEMVAELAKVRPYHISRTQISADLVKLSKLWQADAIESRTASVAKILKKLARQERELWISWHKSKQDATTKTAEKSDDAGGKGKRKGGTKTKVTVEGRHGDPAIMRLILDIQHQTRELQGLDLPKELKLLCDADNPMLVIVKHANEVKTKTAGS